MILNETYPLANGVQVPKLGLGTWFIDDAEAAEAVREAVRLGYRLIDTAQAYGNERGVGEGVRTCGVRREELFVASKVAAELKTYEDAAKSIDETLERMGLGYLDQMIIHSPQPWSEFRVEKRYFEENKKVWRALEDAQAAGKVKVIGVSNFLQDDLENLLGSCRVMPMVNQILLHITNTDSALVDFCKAQGIQVEAYSPIAHGEALKNPAIVKMAEKYGVSAAQLWSAVRDELTHRLVAGGFNSFPTRGHSGRGTSTYAFPAGRPIWRLGNFPGSPAQNGLIAVHHRYALA